MSNIDITSNPFLQSVSNEKTQQAEKGDELGQDAFLRLMIAQLENQDPLSPAENGEFIAQLAQFSSVEGITNLNTAVGDLVSEFRSSRALEASALVGRQVEINSSVGSLPPQGDLKATVALPASTDRLQISVLSQTGEIVHVEEVRAQGAGDVPFSWNGINEDGEQQPAGRYQLRAIALLDGEPTEVPVKVAANVNSVSIGSDNSMTLNIDGIGKVPLDSVSRFL